MNRQSLFCILLSTLYSCNINALAGIGEVAAQIYEPVAVMIQLVRSVSIICGSGLILGGILRYVDYRRNPAAVRLSVVIFMFVFGIALIIVGFIPMNLGESYG
jgi:uncharacterized membrane protein